jgi:hypothetical protein
MNSPTRTYDVIVIGGGRAREGAHPAFCVPASGARGPN